MQDLVRQHLLRAQDRMKRQADKHRVERQFSVESDAGFSFLEATALCAVLCGSPSSSQAGFQILQAFSHH